MYGLDLPMDRYKLTLVDGARSWTRYVEVGPKPTTLDIALDFGGKTDRVE